jgi:hypothetical protein
LAYTGVVRAIKPGQAGIEQMMTLKIGRRATHAVKTIADAVRIYCDAREASMEGASTFPDGSITAAAWRNGLRISYNGRVWDGDKIVAERS